ncbi:hypothetical protein [Curtobacterium flaccumfaciens]|uniref:hypothetical protein n=1 Tax=Curtobacterium flaccumfaciens TaxID=2035 RepID=UPI00126794EC|nr:hypothetical protein [Curtobacterium flaccumfaciens]
MSDIWSWSGWAGVQGLASVVGVGAVATAVVDFVSSRDLRVGEVVNLGFETHRERGNWDYQHVKVRVYVTGPQSVYGAAWRVWGTNLNLPKLPRVIDAATNEQTIEFSIHRDKLASTRIGVVWLVPRRFLPFARGLRRSLDLESPREVYKRRRWPWWPFKRAGHWVKPRRRWRYQRRFLFVPED